MENALSRERFFNELEDSFLKIREDIIKAQKEVSLIKEFLKNYDFESLSNISDISGDDIVEQ